jgi:hypothetical protein
MSDSLGTDPLLFVSVGDEVPVVLVLAVLLTRLTRSGRLPGKDGPKKRSAILTCCFFPGGSVVAA